MSQSFHWVSITRIGLEYAGAPTGLRSPRTMRPAVRGLNDFPGEKSPPKRSSKDQRPDVAQRRSTVRQAPDRRVGASSGGARPGTSGG